MLVFFADLCEHLIVVPLVAQGWNSAETSDARLRYYKEISPLQNLNTSWRIAAFTTVLPEAY